MLAILSAIITVFFVGISSGGLLVSRRIEPNQSLFIVVGLVFFLSCYIGMFVGSKIGAMIGTGGISVIFAFFCFGLIGFFIWKYDPAFGYVKQEPMSLTVLIAFFFLLGMELANLTISFWLSILYTMIFIGGSFLGFLFVYRLLNQYRSIQLLVLSPLVPLLFIGLFKLI